MSRQPWLVLALVLALLPASPAPSPQTSEAVSPTTNLTVPFVLLRVDCVTRDILEVYRFEQPYRKHLPPEGFQQTSDIFYDFLRPSDYGYLHLRSRLTGQAVFEATTIWIGRGELEWPTPAQLVTGYARGSSIGDPEVFGSRAFSLSTTETQAPQVWESVRDLDLIAAIAQQGPYGVFVFDHQYAPPFGPFEFGVLVYGRPRAPTDAAIVRQVWPRTLVTRGVRTVPEVRVHNFSDEPLDLELEVELGAPGGAMHASRRSLAAIPPDSSSDVSFDALVPLAPDPITFTARLVAAGGGQWMDTFFDNDSLERPIEVTALPVFRVKSSVKQAGPIPLNGDMLDFDGDGDLDVIQPGLHSPVFLQNDGAGQFTETTSRVTATFRPFHRRALTRDFTGDGVPDVILEYFGGSPILLRGEADRFREITMEAGLTGYSQSTGLEALDVDADGDQDLILRGSGFGGVVRETVLLNDATGRFIEGTQGSGLGDDLGRTLWIATGLIDADARPDLLFVNFDSPATIHLNQGGGVYAPGGSISCGARCRMAVILDYDRDGRQDVLMAGDSGNQLFRQGDGLAFDGVTAQSGQLGAAFFADSTDVDGDGWMDLALDGDGPNLLLNEGGTFADGTRLLVDLPEHVVEFAGHGNLDTPRFQDFDGDGDLDIYSRSVVFENLGLPPETIAVHIDIRPGQAINVVQPSGGGVLPVALLGSDGFDVDEVDTSTLTFGPGMAPLAHRHCPHRGDVNGDGQPDLLGHFKIAEAGLTPGDQVACLEGRTRDGVPIRGCDLVRVVPPSGPGAPASRRQGGISPRVNRT